MRQMRANVKIQAKMTKGGPLLIDNAKKASAATPKIKANRSRIEKDGTGSARRDGAIAQTLCFVKMRRTYTKHDENLSKTVTRYGMAFRQCSNKHLYTRAKIAPNVRRVSMRVRSPAFRRKALPPKGGTTNNSPRAL